MTDAALMRRALVHAARAQGCTAPNPMVGAVVVNADGIIVGQGSHARAGDAHAEVVALDGAGASARGGTLYVTLEPCCHVGRTGPCTERILAAGITRVVAAVQDPNPAVSGRGFAELRDRGVHVEVGLLSAAASRLNAGFFSVHERGRPLVIVKAATSSDGRIAARPGEATPFSGPEARRAVQCLRAATDAVAVGVGTVLTDNPRLTVREVVRQRPYVRVVFDRHLRTPADAALLSTRDHGPVFIVADVGASSRASARAEALQRAGAELLEAESVTDALRALVAREVMSVLVEGGGRLHAACFAEGVVDRVHLVVSGRGVGPEGVPVFGGATVPWSALQLTRVEARGDDTWIEADVHRTH